VAAVTAGRVAAGATVTAVRAAAVTATVTAAAAVGVTVTAPRAATEIPTAHNRHS
jgi:hypothetical protein